jgi:hypothetical protein
MYALLLFLLLVLIGILYATNEYRTQGQEGQEGQEGHGQRVPSPVYRPVASSPALQTAYPSSTELSQTRKVIKEDEDVEQMIQAKLTQKGLKEMTESGQYSSSFATVL